MTPVHPDLRAVRFADRVALVLIYPCGKARNSPPQAGFSSLMFYRALWGAARQDPQGALRGPTG